MRMTQDELAEFMRRGVQTTKALAEVYPGLTPEAVKTVASARRRRVRREDGLQRAVVEYWSRRYPATWEKTFHPPNGLAAKTRALAAIFKGLGVKPGVFDLVCIARRGVYNGLALELKADHGRVSESQDAWLARFTCEGWYACVAWDVDEAVAAIDRYHAMPEAHT